jgi:hypothetical protein
LSEYGRPLDDYLEMFVQLGKSLCHWLIRPGLSHYFLYPFKFRFFWEANIYALTDNKNKFLRLCSSFLYRLSSRCSLCLAQQFTRSPGGCLQTLCRSSEAMAKISTGWNWRMAKCNQSELGTELVLYTPILLAEKGTNLEDIRRGAYKPL